MAAKIGMEDGKLSCVATEDIAEEPRQSMLDVLLHSLKGKSIYSRILILLTYSPGKPFHSCLEDAFATWEKTLDGKQDLSGLIVAQEHFATLLLEGTTSVLFSALKMLSSYQASATHGFRLFPFRLTVEAKFVDEDLQEDEEITDDTVFERVFSTYTNMIRLARYVAANNFRTQESLDESQRNGLPKALLPLRSSVLILDESPLSHMNTWTDKEFLDFFTGPFDLRLASEPVL